MISTAVGTAVSLPGITEPNLDASTIATIFRGAAEAIETIGMGEL
ncbi:hypothetical protein [Arthrobacter sp. Br18]|nr:hypothetical protein [Arthrobacter sp. Br18]